MQRIDHCPVCTGKSVKVLKEHVFTFPGDDVHNHIHDYKYFALWTLFERVLKARDDASFDAATCDDCGFIYSNPRFSEEDISTKYETFNELGANELASKTNPPYNLEGRAQRTFDLVNRYYTSYSGVGKPRILDLGGGAGYNLVPFVKDWECKLVDYGNWDFPDGVTKLANDHRELAPDEKFQVILLLHTLEHVPEPVPFLKTVADHLDDDGAVYIEVPLGAFGEWKFMAEPLMHLNFFSEQSVVRAAQEAGLHVSHVSTRNQWVTHNKLWCINVIAYKKVERTGSESVKPLSTVRQMKKLNYYIPYLFNPRIVKKVLRKILGK
jgi:SAM-dependent methyltransferase